MPVHRVRQLKPESSGKRWFIATCNKLTPVLRILASSLEDAKMLATKTSGWPWPKHSKVVVTPERGSDATG